MPDMDGVFKCDSCGAEFLGPDRPFCLTCGDKGKWYADPYDPLLLQKVDVTTYKDDEKVLLEQYGIQREGVS